MKQSSVFLVAFALVTLSGGVGAAPIPGPNWCFGCGKTSPEPGSTESNQGSAASNRGSTGSNRGSAGSNMEIAVQQPTPSPDLMSTRRSRSGSSTSHSSDSTGITTPGYTVSSLTSARSQTSGDASNQLQPSRPASRSSTLFNAVAGPSNNPASRPGSPAPQFPPPSRPASPSVTTNSYHSATDGRSSGIANYFTPPSSPRPTTPTTSPVLPYDVDGSSQRSVGHR